MKAVLTRERFRDPDWIFERKLDGIREWTGSRRLRHPRFLGLRDDKPARSVVSEQ
jgi:bifunctional non-homologous end joining protein LigD